MISLIIPFRDKVELLRQCVESVLNMSTYRDFEVILVDNESKKKETAEYLKEVGNGENLCCFSITIQRLFLPIG